MFFANLIKNSLSSYVLQNNYQHGINSQTADFLDDICVF